MRAVLPKLLVLGLVWGLTPGLTEVTENLWHLAASGHSAHAAEEGPDHAPQDEEHGCTGTFHLCSCHHSQASDRLPASLPRLEDPGHAVIRPRTSDAPEPSPHRLDRPPRA